jgi:hypothetical protein
VLFVLLEFITLQCGKGDDKSYVEFTRFKGIGIEELLVLP